MDPDALVPKSRQRKHVEEKEGERPRYSLTLVDVVRP